jgi:hypothetical protein
MVKPRSSTEIERSDELMFPASRVPALVALALGPLTALLASGALGIWWVAGTVGLPVGALVGCAAGVVVGLGVVGWAVRQLWLAPCLVLDSEALRVIRGAGQVMMHIPYRNIAGVTYLKEEAARSARIDLIDAFDPATYLANAKPGSSSVQLALTWSNLPRYAAKPRAIVEAIQLRLSEFRETQPSAGNTTGTA